MSRATSFRPAPFPAPLRATLQEALADEHAAVPFGPEDVRAAARRVVAVVEELGHSATIVRGGVDLGGAELDHVFVVVEDRVVDVALPVHARAFTGAVRAWVAGDLALDELSGRAARYGIEHRVLGEYPAPLRYRGAPLWGSAA